jgi:tripartite-type tricarboxylate transporter receptor subunit TctC
MLRMFCAALFAAVCTQLAAPAAAAARYPERPIRLIAPFPPGGGVDINARLLADPLGAALGQTIVVDNRGGAAGRLGLELAAKATPDGYTLAIGGTGMAISRALYRKLPYDTLRDFVTISLLSTQPNILVAHSSIPAKSLADLVALAKAQPGKLTHGSPGVGSATHLATVLLTMTLNVNVLHVPYKGTGPALNALLSNEITMNLSTFASALPHVKANRLRAFGVTSAKRAPTLPDVPTLAEAGASGYEYATWYGLVAPAGVPRAIVDQISKATVAVLNTPEIRKLYDMQGLDAIPSTPDYHAAYLRTETEKWAKAVRAVNVQLD